jgi:integrase
MAFVTEKEELKPGLILFRRGDVEHRMWYCRMKMPKADRYKTVSLKTSDKEAARERASIKTQMCGSASSMTFLCSTAPSAK